MKSRVSKVNDIYELYKCWFHSILSICMFIYTVLLTSSLHCTPSTGGKWKYFILENYFFNPHFSGRSRRNIWSNVITCCFYDDPAPLLLVKALTVFWGYWLLYDFCLVLFHPPTEMYYLRTGISQAFVFTFKYPS